MDVDTLADALDIKFLIMEQLDRYIKLLPLVLSDKEKEIKVNSLLTPLVLKAETVLKTGDIFEKEMALGITEHTSSLQMENTYVPELLDGTESGEFMGLDLGGTNFRILYVKLENGRHAKELVEYYHIEDALRAGFGTTLFDYLAECISSFVHKYNMADKLLPLGFTFSFPMHQHALDSGILVTWTKSFSAFGVVGEDAAQLLREALQRRTDHRVQLVAILNDSTGTLLEGALLDPKAAVGLILGNGTNACYIEKADNVKHWETERHGEKEVIVDIEWGAFGDNGVVEYLKTEYDKVLDANSYFSNSFTFEKYISNLYLGELVRLILERLVREELLFTLEAAELKTSAISEKGSFPTTYVCDIERDSEEGLIFYTEKIIKELGIVNYDEDDIRTIQRVCHLVSFRAALLVSTCLGRVLRRIDRQEVTVAVDGPLYKRHPRLHRWILKYTALMAPEKKLRLLGVTDGSGKGAALLASIAIKLASRIDGASVSHSQSCSCCD